MSSSRRICAAMVTLAMVAAPLLSFALPAASAPAPAFTYSLDPIPGLEYVAIAPLAWADNLQPLIAWKNEKGVPAQVFPLEYILPEYPGQNEERIHAFLQDLHFNKAPTTKWLLLVGDGDWDNPVIPDFEVFTNSQQDGDYNNSQNWYTTDTYYGNLQSNWDENNNGIRGELDEGDWTPELYVGRVPVDSASEVDRWVARQVTYERNPPMGVWMHHGILAGALMDRPNILDNLATRADEGYDPFTDNARKVDEEVAAEAPAWMDLERFYDYPAWDGGNYSPATDNLVVGAVKSALNSGASFMLMEGHGYTSNQGVAQYADPAGTKSIFRSDGEDPALRYNEVLNLTNGDRLPFVYVSACYSGDFTDRDDTSFEAFLKAPAGGAIAVVAGNGENYRMENVSGQQAFGNWWLAQQFFHMLFIEGYSQPGKVLGDLKARYNAYYLAHGPTDAVNENYFRAERVSYNLMGDPEFSLITDEPAGLSAAPLHQPLVGEPLVQVQVAGRGGALPGALVHLSSPTADLRATTNAAGVADLPYFVADTTPFNLTVTAPNHLPLSTSVQPSLPEHNLAFEPSTLLATGVPRTNQTIRVEGTVTARGLTSYSNVIVEFRLGNPATGTSLTAILLPIVAPGAPIEVLTTLSFPEPGDFLVYATIDPAGEEAQDTRADDVAFTAIHINAPPQVLPIPVIHLPEGGVLAGALPLSSYVADRENGSFGLTYRITYVSDPAVVVSLDGATLSFEAMPGAGASATVELEASDGLDTGRGTFEVEVMHGNLPPVIAPVDPKRATVGVPFSLNLSGSDPEHAAIAWSDNAPFFDVTPQGRIAFTPTADAVGSYAVTVTASDGRAQSSYTFLLTIEKVPDAIEVHNPALVRVSAGREVVLDLNRISSDPEVTFIADNPKVHIDAAARTLSYTPEAGGARTELLVLTAYKPGFAPARVALNVDVAASPPGGGADVLLFALAGAGLAFVVVLTERRARQLRLRDERAFKIKGKPPKAKGSSKGKAARKGRDAAAKQPKGRREEE